MATLFIPRTLDALPVELLEIILHHLDQHHLAQCARVSQSWRLAATPYLWQTIGPFSQAQLNRFASNEAQMALAKNAAFVRELHLDSEKLYDLLFPPFTTRSSDTAVNAPATNHTTSIFTNLRTLELCPLESQKARNEVIIALVQQNPEIRRFTVRMRIDTWALLILVSKYLPNLHHFCLDMPIHLDEAGHNVYNPWHGDVKMLLENLPECIRTVTLLNVVHRKDDSYNSSERENSRVRAHHALESIHIDGSLAGYDVEVLVPFLESCSDKLQIATGLSVTFLTQPEIVNALSKIGFASKMLFRDVDPSYTPLDQDLAEIISRSSQWTRICLMTSITGPLAAAAIVDNGENLQSLEIMHGGILDNVITGSHMQAVLSKAPKLKTLLGHWLVNGNEITAADILSSEWATTSLEHIDFKINVPRATYEAESLESTAIQSSRDIQRQILRRLGQQKNLRKILIGGMVFSHSAGNFVHQDSCLEMTLTSGLDELAGLKNLEELDIHHMDHRVGVPELQWMTENFPRLRKLYGMNDSLIPPSQEVREWLETYRPSWGH